MADSKEKLFSDFSPVSTEQWMEKVTADLKGADFEKKLVWKTNEGFKVKPFYRMEDLEGLKTTDALPGEFPYLRGTKKDNNEWFVRQEIKVECPQEANAKALDILNKGIDSLSFHVKAKELNAEYIETLLNDICAECIELNFSTCQGHVVELANLLVAYFQKKDYDVKKLQGSINFDYFNKMLSRGKEKGDMIQTAKALLEAIQPLPFYRVLNVNALSLNNAGAYISQELGYALAWGNEYMNQLTEAGLPAALVAKKIKFNFGISSNYFLEIAKFRAARMLWANIVASYKKKGTSDWQTSPINLAHYYIKDNKIYVQLHITQILSTRASISDMVSMLVDMQMYLMEGIPMTYSLTADAVQIGLATDEAKAILSLLTSDFLRDKVIGILPEDISPVVKPILEQMPDVLKETTKLEIQLSLKK